MGAAGALPAKPQTLRGGDNFLGGRDQETPNGGF